MIRVVLFFNSICRRSTNPYSVSALVSVKQEPEKSSAANHGKSKFFPAVSGLASRKRHPRLTAKDCLTPHRSFLDWNWGNKILYVRVEIGLQILAYRFWDSQPQTLPEMARCAR